MASRNEGLTLTYNRFHTPAEISSDIAELRCLHVEMDQAVATAYGWQAHVLALGHGFHETKQGIRYTISETARREVLDRLLELNHQRHAEEVAAGLHDKKASKPVTRRSSQAPTGAPVQPDLFGDLQPDLFEPPPAPADGPAPLLAYLQANPGWHGKEAVLAATGYPAARWSTTINDLLATGQVERQGERRGARYRAVPASQ